jgi:hypothetical protein
MLRMAFDNIVKQPYSTQVTMYAGSSSKDIWGINFISSKNSNWE